MLQLTDTEVQHVQLSELALVSLPFQERKGNRERSATSSLEGISLLFHNRLHNKEPSDTLKIHNFIVPLVNL